MANDRNSISVNVDNIIEALKEYDLWDELTIPERTQKASKINEGHEMNEKLGQAIELLRSKRNVMI